MSDLRRPSVGDEVRILDGSGGRDAATAVAYRCYGVGGRCTHWISSDATVRRRYEDTGKWSAPQLPRCDEEGVLRAPNGQRLDAVLAAAWHAPGTSGRARLVDPRAGLVADNVAPAGKRRAQPPATHLPPCVARALAAAAQGSLLSDVCGACDVTADTALTYLSRGVALVGPTAGVPGLVHAPLRRSLRRVDDLSGSLSQLRERLDLPHTEWTAMGSAAYGHLRLGRMCEEHRRREEGGAR